MVQCLIWDWYPAYKDWPGCWLAWDASFTDFLLGKSILSPITMSEMEKL